MRHESDKVDNVNIAYQLILSYPQFRRTILLEEGGLERCLHFLMETNDRKQMFSTH